MSVLPYFRQFPPASTALPSALIGSLEPETPFGIGCSQVLKEANIRRLVAEMAKLKGLDARAITHIESHLRWNMHERTSREPVVFSHDSLVAIDYGDIESVDAPPYDRSLLGEGLLLVVACRIVPTKEAWHAYRELLSGEPIAALHSALTLSEESTFRMSEFDVAALTPVERTRLEMMRTKYPRGGADRLFADCNKIYPTTLDMLATDLVDEPPPPPPVVAVVAAAVASVDVDSDDDLPMAAMANRRGPPAPVVAPIREPSPPLAPERREMLEMWQKSVIAARQFGVDIIVRGYVMRQRIRTARRLVSPAGTLHYVLSPSAVFSDADAALLSERRLAPAPVAPPVEEGDVEAPPEEPAAVPLPLPAPVWERHLLDRLETIDLPRLTFYEIDRATRDRLSVHLLLYEHTSTNTEVENRAYINLYPRTWRSPVLQPYTLAPGLTGMCSAYDYAAIGLAGLCIAAAVQPALAQWLLESEAYLHRVRLPDGDPTRYLLRVQQQIEKSHVPRVGSSLADMIEDIVAVAESAIQGTQGRFAVEEVADDEEADGDAVDEVPADDAMSEDAADYSGSAED